MSDPLHIVILAAGQGKRMQSALPKVLLPLAGKPMLLHVIETAQQLNPETIHVVHGHRGEQVRQALDHVAINWVEQTEQLGTGHAVRLAVKHVPESARVLVLYADMPLLKASSLQTLVTQTTSLAVLAACLDEPKGYGRIVLNSHQQVSRIVEERDASAEERAIKLTNTGMLCARAKPLARWLSQLNNHNSQGEYYITDIFAMAAAENQPANCIELEDNSEAMGANNPWQLAQLEARFRQRCAFELASQGVRLADPARFDQRGTVNVGKDVEIDVGVIFEGHVTLGNNVRIGPFCRLKNVHIAANTTVLSHCDLEGIEAGENCHIGPFARLRPGTRLDDAVHIGDFVETKKTHIGKGSKANHLSYLGDTHIGENVNIGAGTITCNYDGINKFPTSIEDGAFIGSNASLVAPVKIGKMATVGAGSVITRSINAQELGIGRGRQKNIDHWSRPKKKQDTNKGNP